MKIAVYPGSFDPISNGHLDIITRASKLVDTLYVLVSVNPNKHYVFTDEERKKLVEKTTADLSNVKVVVSADLVLNFAAEVHADAMIRGLRNHSDFDAEMQLYQFNHTINHQIETIFLFPSANNLFLSSSSIKELVLFDSDISPYVPSCILKEIYHTIKTRLSKRD